MLEVDEKNIELEEKSLESLFSDAQETLDEAKARKAAEDIFFSKVKYFTMGEADTYRLRILPLSPKSDRRGYEYPVRQMLLNLSNQDPKSKKKNIYVKVCRATDAGYSIDLIDTYKKIAIGQVQDDEEMVKKIKSGSFGGGLGYSYNHAIYVYNLDKINDGILLWEASNGQYKSLEDQKELMWKKLIDKSKNPKYPCPISSWNKAYPVEIQKKKGAKTEYVFSIDTISDICPMDEKQMKELMDAPLLTDVIYRYSKYHMEATIEYLKQYDQESDLNVMQHEDMINAIEILKGELPADDTSSFSFKSGDSNEEENEKAITFDKLSSLYDALQGAKKSDKTDEGQNLRSLISEYIKDRNLSVKFTRSKTIADLLNEIEDEIEEIGKEPIARTSKTTSVKEKIEPEKEVVKEKEVESEEPEEDKANVNPVVESESESEPVEETSTTTRRRRR